MNYHAGTAVRSSAHSVVVVHSGVQFCDENPDELTAMLLLMACDTAGRFKVLSKVRFDINLAAQQLLQFMNNDEGTFMITTADRDFCKGQAFEVELHCFCMTPWIEGTTSAIIYGSKQKDFDMHICCKCATSIVLELVVLHLQEGTKILFAQNVKYQTL